MKNKEDLILDSAHYFETHPRITEISATSDGLFFVEASEARSYANQKGLDWHVIKKSDLVVSSQLSVISEENPIAEAPVVETPVEETPIAPIVETPVVEAPIVETPVAEAPVAEAPIVETPIIETPVVKKANKPKAE